jgi:hypothetical protein
MNIAIMDAISWGPESLEHYGIAGSVLLLFAWMWFRMQANQNTQLVALQAAQVEQYKNLALEHSRLNAEFLTAYRHSTEAQMKTAEALKVLAESITELNLHHRAMNR